MKITHCNPVLWTMYLDQPADDACDAVVQMFITISISISLASPMTRRIKHQFASKTYAECWALRGVKSIKTFKTFHRKTPVKNQQNDKHKKAQTSYLSFFVSVG